MRTCRVCKVTKEKEEFKEIRRYDTTTYRDTTCIACRAAKMPRILIFDKEELINTFDDDILYALYLKCTVYY